MRVWKFDDCDYVAAKSLEEAVHWYDEQFGAPLGGEREIEEYGIDTEMAADESGQGDGRRMTFQKRIEELRAEGETFPAVIGFDSHYA